MTLFPAMKVIITTLLLAACAAGVHAQSLPGLTITGNNFTYDAPDGQVTGIFLKPSGGGPFGAALISHGKGGSATAFSLGHANTLVQWGLVCIGPNYTHAGAGSTPDNEGYSPENSRRARRCLEILAATPGVDTGRTALFGHSMGGFLTAGLAGEVPSQVRAVCLGAAGTSGTSNTGIASPSVQEVQGITAPVITFHGTADTTVLPAQSVNLHSLLSSSGVPNRRLLYQGVPHNIMDANQKRADVHAITRAWFTTHGVLVYPGNTAPVMNVPPVVRVAAGVASLPLPVTVTDSETPGGLLTVQAFSTDADVAGSTTPPVTAYSGRLQNSGLAWGGSGTNRTLTITPRTGVTGTVEAALVVTDNAVGGGQLAAVRHLNIVIESSVPALTLGSSQGGAALNAQQGAALNASLTANGGAAPYTWMLAGGALPEGVLLGANGALSGTPAQTGGFSFTAFILDSTGVMGSQAYSLTVGSSLTVGGANPPAAVTGAAYTHTFTVTSASGAVVWTLAAGTLPPGLALGADGVLSGTPATPGSYVFRIQATDSLGLTGALDVTLAAFPPLVPPTPGEPASGTLQLSWQTAPGFIYQIEWSTDLEEWFPAAPPVAGGGGQMGWTDDGTVAGTPPGAAGRRFYRLRISAP